MVEDNVKYLDRIRDFVREAQKQFPVEKVYLFGSHAKGTANIHSDIDIVILSAAFEKMAPFDRLVALGKIAWKAGTPEIEAIGYTPKEFYEAPPWEFSAEIRESGMLVM